MGEEESDTWQASKLAERQEGAHDTVAGMRHFTVVLPKGDLHGHAEVGCR